MPFSSVIREKEINKYLKQRNTEEEHRVPGQVFIVDIFNLRNGIGLNFLNKLLYHIITLNTSPHSSLGLPLPGVQAF